MISSRPLCLHFDGVGHDEVGELRIVDKVDTAALEINGGKGAGAC